jgi:hypothetical protein
MDNYKSIDISTAETLNALIYYLGLPEDKIGLELRFRAAMENQSTAQTDKKRKKGIQYIIY